MQHMLMKQQRMMSFHSLFFIILCLLNSRQNSSGSASMEQPNTTSTWSGANLQGKPLTVPLGTNATRYMLGKMLPSCIFLLGLQARPCPEADLQQSRPHQPTSAATSSASSMLSKQHGPSVRGSSASLASASALSPAKIFQPTYWVLYKTHELEAAPWRSVNTEASIYIKGHQAKPFSSRATLEPPAWSQQALQATPVYEESCSNSFFCLL